MYLTSANIWSIADGGHWQELFVSRGRYGGGDGGEVGSGGRLWSMVMRDAVKGRKVCKDLGRGGGEVMRSCVGK